MAISAAAAALGSAAIGGYASNKASKRASRAQNKATEASMAGFNLAEPYLSNFYEGTDQATRDATNNLYTGPTRAGMDPRTREGLDYRYNTALNNMGIANDIMGQTSGFANNAASLYDQASQDQLQGAIDYASGDRLDSLTASALRDPYRQLTENTLTGIDNQAMSTGNLNSSRAGIAEAVANRSFNDRAADTRARIQDSLMNQYMRAEDNRLRNMTNANNNLAGFFGDAYGFQSGIANDLIGVGSAYQGDAQAQLADDMRQQNLTADQALDYFQRQAGIMSGAPTSPPQVTPNLYDPSTAALTGAMSGYQFGKDLFGGGTTAPAPMQTTFDTGFNNSYYQPNYTGPVGSLYSGGL